MLWIVNIWLKATRRKRTFNHYLSFPFRDELEVAKKLSTCNNLKFILSAASIYAEAGFSLYLKNFTFNEKEVKKYNLLAAELVK